MINEFCENISPYEWFIAIVEQGNPKFRADLVFILNPSTGIADCVTNLIGRGRGEELLELVTKVSQQEATRKNIIIREVSIVTSKGADSLAQRKAEINGYIRRENTNIYDKYYYPGQEC
jgi:hypothetical protein